MQFPLWIRNPKGAWRAWLEGQRFRLMPRIADRLLDWSTFEAKAKLTTAGRIGVLVDSTIHHHAVTHETAWVSTGTKLWGGVHPIDTGYMARIPVHRRDSDKAAYQDIKFLPGIIHIAKLGHVNLLTSAELDAERERQPNSRFRPTGWSDYSLLSGVRLESVDGRAWGTIYPGWRNGPESQQDRQLARIHASDDRIFRGLVAALGKSNSLDAWHIRTAEAHGLPYFLTMDRKLLKTIRAQSGHPAIKTLTTKVVSPSDLARSLGLKPFPPVLLSYHDASFPVRADFHMPAEERRRYRKPAPETQR